MAWQTPHRVGRKGIDVEAGSGARAPIHVWSMAWCGCLTYALSCRRRSGLLHYFLHVSARSARLCRPRPKSCGLPMRRSRYSKPVMRSVCSNLVLLSIHYLAAAAASGRTARHTQERSRPQERCFSFYILTVEI